MYSWPCLLSWAGSALSFYELFKKSMKRRAFFSSSINLSTWVTFTIIPEASPGLDPLGEWSLENLSRFYGSLISISVS